MDRDERKYGVGFFLSVALLALLAGTCPSCGRSAVPVPQGPVKEYKLDAERYRTWNRIHDEWIKYHFMGCLKKSRIRMSCASCTNAYILVELSIGQDGRLKGYRKVRENVCARPVPAALEECFLEYFRGIVFPENLRGLVIETRLGTGLKC